MPAPAQPSGDGWRRSGVPRVFDLAEILFGGTLGQQPHNTIRTTQKCKRYLNLEFKYLVLFRRRNVSLVPFGVILTLPPPPWDFATAISAEEGKSGSSRASEHHQNYDSFSAPERITKIYQLQAKIHPAHSLASPTSTTVYNGSAVCKGSSKQGRRSTTVHIND
jgi:hypothetical protein